VIISFVCDHDARAQEIKLTYEPKKGDSAVYDLQVHAKATDEDGLILVTHANSTLEAKVAGVKRDPAVPVDQDNISGATVDVVQKNGSVKFVSGENEKTVDFGDRSVSIRSTKAGQIVTVMGGGAGKVITDSIMEICRKLGATAAPTRGDKWQVPVTLSIMGENVSGEVAYALGDVAEIGGEQCIVVTSTGSISHKFRSKERLVDKMEMTWQAKACYAYANGTFAQVVVNAKAVGALRDGTRAQVVDLNLQMIPRKEGAALPAAGAKRALAGAIGGGHFPVLMVLAAAGLLALGATVRRIRRPIMRKALVCGLSAVIVIYGTPLDRAEAASPAALIAFSGAAMQALHDVAGMAVAGVGGVAMTGTAASVLSTPYGTIPPWAGMPVSDATDDLEGGFLQAAEGDQEPVGAIEPTAGGGLFSTTNMLIGGAVIAASAGVGIAAAGSGGGGGGTACPTIPALVDFSAPPNPIPGQFDIVLVVRPRAIDGAADDPPDAVNVYLNGGQIAALVIDNPAGDQVAFDLDPGDNVVTLEYAAGGHNDCVIVRAIFSYLGGSVDNPNVWIGPGGNTSCTITLQQPPP